MDEGLLLKEREERQQREDKSLTWVVLGQEMKRLVYIAGPMLAMTLSEYVLQIISLMMVGHLGELYLSSTAIASSLCSVTGLSILEGMAGALETLCGQAYGAQQYQKIGTQTYTAIFSLIIVCIPLSILWMYMGRILILIGQDPLISQEAGKFTMWLIPALFAYATIQPLIRYFQMQSMVIPMCISSCATLCLHIPLCWVLVFKSGLANVGAALAIDISMWLNVIILGLYMKYSSTCEKTRVPISMDVFQGIGEFFSFAIPSVLMLCLEWWSYEIITLLSGLLPNPQLETSVLSVCLNTLTMLYCIAYGLGSAVRFAQNLMYCLDMCTTVSSRCCVHTILYIVLVLSLKRCLFFSTRVSNELGAGNPRGARVAVFAVILLAVIETSIVSTIFFANRHVFGYAFSNEKEVVDNVTAMAPLLCLSVIMDSLLGVLSGVARGCGWQDIGAYINLAAFYLFGIPIAVALGFWAQLRAKGLWIGIQAGAILQTILLCVITSCTNWEKQGRLARERLLEETSSADNGVNVN